jgi:hypothetical protein
VYLQSVLLDKICREIWNKPESELENCFIENADTKTGNKVNKIELPEKQAKAKLNRQLVSGRYDYKCLYTGYDIRTDCESLLIKNHTYNSQSSCKKN